MKFVWDIGNLAHAQRHGVSAKGIEAAVTYGAISPDLAHSNAEERFKAIGKTAAGRSVFVIFTLRGEGIRPVSARYMHGKEVEFYEKARKTPKADH